MFQIEKLTEKLEQIWREIGGCVILFDWFSFLKEQSLSYLSIGDVIDVSEIFQEHDLHQVELQHRDAEYGARWDITKSPNWKSSKTGSLN